MGKALGMIEYQTVSRGIEATDIMLKTGEVELIEAHPVCPGKYIALISGDLSSVRASVDAAKARYGSMLIDSFVLGNPHEMIFPALCGGAQVDSPRALGVVETYSAASIIVAADAAAKTSDVCLIELRVAKGMCGKSYVTLTGEIAAVKAAVDRAVSIAGEGGMLLDSAVIANPDKALWKTIM